MTQETTNHKLAKSILSTDEINLLKKGFTFTPTSIYDSFTWVKDINLFARKLALHKYHKSFKSTTQKGRSID